MHRIVVTEGVVLGKRAVGESNTLLFLLTPELGVVRVSARSARKEVSKLRYGLEPLTMARYSMVRGRHEWKLTGVEAVSRACNPTHSLLRVRAGKVSRLVLRLVHGEERSILLYTAVRDGLHALANTAPEDGEALECILVLRILACLGYVAPSEDLLPLLHAPKEAFVTPHTLSAAHSMRTILVRTINASLAATGL